MKFILGRLAMVMFEVLAFFARFLGHFIVEFLAGGDGDSDAGSRSRRGGIGSEASWMYPDEPRYNVRTGNYDRKPGLTDPRSENELRP